MVLGEDVGRAGGVFRATAGLRDRFGPDRCVDTPLAEAGILGSAVGLCMAGFRPVCEMQYDAFSYPCLDQLITHVGRYRWRTGGKMAFPITIRMPYGGGVRAPELHDDSPETYYVHTPGIKVAIPSTPADAKGLLAAAIRDPDPVVILEPKLVYRTERGEVPDGEHVVPLGKARLAREGTDLTLVAYGAMVPVCERAADELDASVEVLDLRSLKPLDEEALLASAAKTGRVVLVQEAPRTCGYAAELAAILAEKAMLDLQAPVAARDRLRRAVSVLADRGRVHAVGRARRRRGAHAARVLVAHHELPLDASALHGHFSRELEPVLTVDPGDSVRFSHAERRLARRTRRAVRAPEPRARHRPRARRADRGARRAGGPGARGADRRGRSRLRGASRSAAPTTGSTGSSRTASAVRSAARSGSRRSSACSACRRRSRASTRRSRRAGAAATSTARSSSPGRRSILPIPVDGALFSAGDGHAAQGDGEVSGTAIEAPVEAQVTLDVRDDLRLEWPVARIDGAWLTFGFDEHLGRAAKIAVDGMLDLMEREHGLAAGDALALASVVVDLRVTQVVNEVLGVHAVLRDDALR